MLYTRKALELGAIAVGLVAFAGQSSLAESSKKDESKPVEVTVPEDAQLMPELTMSSHFVGVPYNSSGVSVSIIDPKQFEEQGVETLTGALSQTPGAFTIDGGATNQRGSVSNTVIRGMSRETYTMTMIDGMRISDVNMSGNKMLGITNLFTVGNVEVVKGAQGAVFGGGAIGGVVSMDTPEGTGDPKTTIFTEVGSYGSFNSYVTSAGKIDKLSYFVGVGFESTENDPNPYPIQFENRTGMNDFRQWQEALRLGYDVNEKVKLSFTYRRLDSYLEYPTPYTNWDTYVTDPHLLNTEDVNRSNLITGRVDAEMTDVWSTSLMVGHYDMHYSTHTPENDYQPNIMRNRRLQGEWRNAFKWNEQWTTVAGIAWDRSDYMCINTYYRQDEWQSTLAFFAEQMWSPTDNFDASLALRLEHDSVWNNHFTWRYSNSWKVTGKDSPTRIFGSVGSGFRAPTYFEQYAANYGYIGNPDLNISKSLGGDLGVEQRLAEGHYASVTGFWTRIDDEIGTATIGTWPNSYTTYTNFSHCTTYGVEVAFKGQMKDALNSSYYANYTFTMPKRDSIGRYTTRQMANTARHTVNAAYQISPTDKLTLGVGVTAAMGRTNYDYVRLDNFFTTRFFAKYQVTENLSIHARLENLFDQDYIITNDYSLGPREARGIGIYGGISYEF